MPKRYTIPAAAVMIAAIIAWTVYLNGENGATAENRTDILAQKGIYATIVTELELDGRIVSGLAGDFGEYGLAVFEPDGGKKYTLGNVSMSEPDKPVTLYIEETSSKDGGADPGKRLSELCW